MRAKRCRIISIIMVCTGMTGCAESIHQVQRDPSRAGISPQLEKQIDRSVTFTALSASPSSFTGKFVKVGGIVLQAKRTKEGTEIEVLQLPLSVVLEYREDRTSSEGRFVAIQQAFLDPATIQPGSRVIVIGKVLGDVKKPLDEIEVTYPLIAIQHLTHLNDLTSDLGQYGSYYGPAYYGPYWGSPYWWSPYPYYWGAPYRYYGYPYSPRRGAFPRTKSRLHSPPQSTPQTLPPQFKKKK